MEAESNSWVKFRGGSLHMESVIPRFVALVGPTHAHRNQCLEEAAKVKLCQMALHT